MHGRFVIVSGSLIPLKAGDALIEQLAARTVGVDVGGTFTDFVFVHPNGRMTVRKYPSTPADPSRSVLEGLQAARAEGLLASRFVLSHGTTVATNALLERRGAKTALITTRGFRDVLEIGRQARSSLYAFHPSRPVPLLPREQRMEVTERLDWQGRVITALDEAEAAELLKSSQIRASNRSLSASFSPTSMRSMSGKWGKWRRNGDSPCLSLPKSRRNLVSLNAPVLPSPTLLLCRSCRAI